MGTLKKLVEIPDDIRTDQFLRFVDIYAKKFKASNGYGKWLAEYKLMESHAMFYPETLRRLYIDIIRDEFKYSYIVKDAVNYICSQALRAVKAFVKVNSFEIRVITGEIAYNDDDEELANLSFEEAVSICKSMNEEAEELLFRVYNSSTHKFI